MALNSPNSQAVIDIHQKLQQNFMKKRFFLKIAALTALLVSAGCTTGSLFKADLLQPLKSGQARIVVLRGFNPQGSGTFPQVRVNGQEIGDLTLGGFGVVDVKPGANVVQLEAGSSTWRFAYSTAKFDYVLADTETLYLQLKMATGTSGVVMSSGRALPAAGYEFKAVSETTATGMLAGLRSIRP